MTELSDIVKKVLGRRVLVVGDLIIDIHHHGEPKGVSSEAPVIVGQHTRSDISHGGAGLVARNVAALGAQAIFVSLVGNDEHLQTAQAIEHEGVRPIFISHPSATTTVKERFLLRGQKVFRWDKLNSAEITPEVHGKVLEAVRSVLPGVDAFIISDYRHGMMNEVLARELIKHAHEAHVPVFVDSQVARTQANHAWYAGADVICLNQTEAKAVYPAFTVENLGSGLRTLKTDLNAGTVVVKLGEKGCAALGDGKVIIVPGYAVKTVDAVGAGDAFVAALASAGTVSGETLAFANQWAALSTTIAGTNPPTRQMVQMSLQSS